MSETDSLLRELSHRVNNNFQIVVSLMNLKKRLLPPDRQDDIRFIEEHVQSMAVAYRLIYATGLILEVPAQELVADVVLGLRLIAKLPQDRVDLDLDAVSGLINLDQSVALALYLAVVLPPYLDHARATYGKILLRAALTDRTVSLSVTASWPESLAMDFLRERLMVAYISQLGAVQDVGLDPARHAISFVVTPSVPAH